MLHEPQAMNVILNVVFKYQQRMIFSHKCFEYSKKKHVSVVTRSNTCTKYSITATSVFMYGTVHYSTIQYSTAQYSTVQYSTVQHSTVQYSTVQYSTVQYSTVHNLMHVQAQVLYCVQIYLANTGTIQDFQVYNFFIVHYMYTLKLDTPAVILPCGMIKPLSTHGANTLVLDPMSAMIKPLSTHGANTLVLDPMSAMIKPLSTHGANTLVLDPMSAMIKPLSTHGANTCTCTLVLGPMSAIESKLCLVQK